MPIAGFIAVILVLARIGLAEGQAAKPNQQKAPSSAGSPAPTYNPFRAVHDVEVGKFYMKRGDVTGAIARFKEAMLYKDNYAEPLLLLGQCYEKKNDPATAVHYYKEYLKILPDSAESKKVRERIAHLQEKMKSRDADAAKS